MKKVLFFIIILVSCKQNSINDTNKKNEKWAWFVNEKSGKGEWLPISDKMAVSTGFYTLFFKTGEIYEEGFIKDSVYIDTARIFDRNGNCIRFKIFENDNRISSFYLNDGEYEEYFPTGELKTKGNVKNNKEIGKWVEYDQKGKIIWKGNYTDNNHWSSFYFWNGSIKDSAYFENNKQQNIYKLWYENGKLSQITSWKDNFQNGDQTYYYDNGQLRGKEFWIDGKIEGYSKHYYPNGKVKFEDNFKNGLRHGLRLDFYDNGNIKSEQRFVNGVPEGIFKWYDTNGVLYQIDTYESGELVNVEKIKTTANTG